MHALYVLDKGHTLLFQKISEVTERDSMPFNGLWTMVLATVIENVLSNGRPDSAFRTRRETLACLGRRLSRSVLLLLFARRIKRHRNTSNSREGIHKRSRYSHHF